MQSIHLFRYDALTKQVYLIAGKQEGIEIIIFEDGNWEFMTKPSFQDMSRDELKKYILTHPTDDEAMRELFINRRKSNAIRYPFSLSDEEMEEILRKKINHQSE